MTDMIERVARAIYPHVAWAYRYAPESGYDGLNEHAKETLAGLARAAIEAMREPTEAMVAAMGSDLTDEGEPRAGTQASLGLARAHWRKGIDAALKGDKP